MPTRRNQVPSFPSNKMCFVFFEGGEGNVEDKRADFIGANYTGLRPVVPPQIIFFLGQVSHHAKATATSLGLLPSLSPLQKEEEEH